MPSYFEGFSFEKFWKQSEYAKKEYVGTNITPQMIESVEQELGYKLPYSYITLLKTQNGGIPNNTNYPTTGPTSWADDHVALTGIMGIDSNKTYSLCGNLGGEFMKQEWGYPDIGVYICDCPSAGHDMIALDYRKCDSNGEPTVVHVDQENDYKVTFLAEIFIRGLLDDEAFDTSEEDLKQDIEKINNGNFSDLLTSLIEDQKDINFNKIIRNLCEKLTIEKGYFALHEDELSYLVYDIQFYLYTNKEKVRSATEYLKTQSLSLHLMPKQFIRRKL